ncbi:MAG: discoidin domain-containing protein [Planctomycetaceae bacterium]|nr:discoidin domain-containing protein [Planctomycetaceae bacterium]
MLRIFKTSALVLLLIAPTFGQQVTLSESASKSKVDKPIRALLVTGGCCHDYARQKLILSRGISARANVVWTVAHQGGSTTNTPIPLYDDPNWSDGFDIVVHNECFSDVKEKAFVENIVKPHRKGLPAILIHCAMHCYRTGDDQWFDFVGMQSPGHGPHYSYTVDNVKPDHPIMKDFGPTFVAPKGELYHSIKLFDTATALGQAKRQGDGIPQTCVWTNQYEKGRVFATTIGHYNETMAEPKYLDMLTRGLLWACDKDIDASFTPSTEKIDEEIRALVSVAVNQAAAQTIAGNCCGESNLAYKKPVTSKSFQGGNERHQLTDGLLNTRWCASGSQGDEWVTVDLEKPEHVKALRIHWEKGGGISYRYMVETSADNENWKLVVDESKNKKSGKIKTHKIDAPDTRYVRTTFLGADGGMWGSIWELEVSAGELPELPKNAGNDAGTAAGISDVQAPDGFNVTLFGTPPDVNYPVCLAAAATGEVFVGVDEQGSLGKEAGRGKVLRCIDTDGDGQADKINTFATMDHPRGLFYDNGSLWVLHPPFLSVYHDDDRDGTADRHDTLITGISTDEVNKRGADHTTNGIRMGIDGWIYIAVGDFGFTEAKGTDGTVLARRGGGIVRVRPDGTEMEIHNWGQRNILDVCIDPYMNIFTRDNTNDGGGWDIRLSHLLQSGEYGYPSLYLNFTEESMPPLADYGGGSGCGAMFFHDLRWPEQFSNTLYTCDWGTSNVYRHNLPANGATFDPHQEVFLKIPRPTDIDVDGSGRMYVSSWKNGKFAYDGPNVGFVAQITPIDFTPKPFPQLDKLDEKQLVGLLSSPSAVVRQHSQLEILRRHGAEFSSRKGKQVQTTISEGELIASKHAPAEIAIVELTVLATDPTAPLHGQVAAIYTLNQLAGESARDLLLKVSEDADVREHALRALTDRKAGLDKLPLEPFIAALRDENPRVRGQALICLGRIGRAEAGEAILPLTARASYQPKPTAEPLYKQADPGRVIPHLAVRALQNSNSVEACLKALEGPYSAGALWALKYMHNEAAVSGLIKSLSSVRNSETRQEILTTLIRLYFREGDYTGGWWGTRPDRTGPYYDRKTWEQSERIASAVKTFLLQADPKTLELASQQLAAHKVEIAGLPTVATTASKGEPEMAIELAKADPNDPNLIANLSPEIATYRALNTEGDAKRGEPLFRKQACVACHTTANGQTPKGPHLVDIGKRYKKAELVESILNPAAKIAQGFDTYLFVMDSGKIVTGFVSGESADEVQVRQTNGIAMSLKKDDIEIRQQKKESMMPVGIANNLTPEQLADLVAYLQSLK